jgi:gas vesicle protein
MERDKRQGNQGQSGSSMMDQAKDTARDLGNQAKDAAGNLADKAKQTASNVADKAKQVASNVGDRADSAVSGAGKGMENLAQTIRDRGPHEGILGSASSSVASTLESGGRYLEEQGLSGVAEDLTNVIRRNPIPAVLIGVGVGFMLARLLTPRS